MSDVWVIFLAALIAFIAIGAGLVTLMARLLKTGRTDYLTASCAMVILAVAYVVLAQSELKPWWVWSACLLAGACCFASVLKTSLLKGSLISAGVLGSTLALAWTSFAAGV